MPVIIGKVIREEKTTYNENPFFSDVLIDIINEEHKRFGSDMEYALRSLCALFRESTFALEKEAAIATSFTSFLEKSMKNIVSLKIWKELDLYEIYREEHLLHSPITKYIEFLR